MIKGHATPQGTQATAEAHPDLQYGPLGSTQLSVSRAGFGGYRIHGGIQRHRGALLKALTSGINLIDTSANYTDGGSETLIGEVLTRLVDEKQLRRDQVVVVSKVGYLQGQNFAMSEKRKKQGISFPELVPCGKAMEHCIHPEFIEDQIGRSLQRLNLETLDVCLLHNPEYFLEWANHSADTAEGAFEEYHRRILEAFSHLEDEVRQGRIQYYGVSSNTFPAAVDDREFTSLSTLLNLAGSLGSDHHFRVIQLPLNLLEPGAVLEENQPENRTVLQLAETESLGVIVNRPLNAFSGNRLIRLAEVPEAETEDRQETIRKIRAVGKSEATFSRKLLTKLPVEGGVMVRIKEQLSVGSHLTHYFRSFDNYEKWRSVRDQMFYPRIQGVMDYLAPHGEDNPALAQWMEDHNRCLKEAFAAVGGIYAGEAERIVKRIRQSVAGADPDWRAGQTLSQQAVRAIRSTAGVSSVLVGMRRDAYVEDVLEELGRPVAVRDRRPSWEGLRQSVREVL